MADQKKLARVAAIEVELGMSAQSKGGVWCKPTVRLNMMVDGGTNKETRAVIIKQAFDEVTESIEKLMEEI